MGSSSQLGIGSHAEFQVVDMGTTRYVNRVTICPRTGGGNGPADRRFVHPRGLIRSTLVSSAALHSDATNPVGITRKTMLFALPDDPAWLVRFHGGDRAVLEQCYRDHVAEALAAAAAILSGVDAETVTHEIFCRLLSEERMRRGFAGGNLGAWIAQVSRNAAIDYQRRRRREVDEVPDGEVPHGGTAAIDDEIEAKMLLERFCRERLPEKWRGVFEERFLRQLPQREAANKLGLQRSTLVYQEQQVRALLTEFLLGPEAT